jgi:hypothetical protein
VKYPLLFASAFDMSKKIKITDAFEGIKTGLTSLVNIFKLYFFYPIQLLLTNTVNSFIRSYNDFMPGTRFDLGYIKYPDYPDTEAAT